MSDRISFSFNEEDITLGIKEINGKFYVCAMLEMPEWSTILSTGYDTLEEAVEMKQVLEDELAVDETMRWKLAMRIFKEITGGENE